MAGRCVYREVMREVPVLTKVALWAAALIAVLAPSGGALMLRTEIKTYEGWPDTYLLHNGLVRLAVTTAVGPRIVDFRLAEGENVLYLRPSELGKSGETTWVFRGGWRLWVAPEETATTYAPDNARCAVEQFGPATIRVTGPVQPEAGIRKSIEISLPENQPRASVLSRIKNVSDRPLTYAAWSLSVMQPGGRAFAPLDVGDLASFSDVRRLILWSYARLSDPRYRFGERLVQVDHAKVKAGQATTGRRPDESKVGVDSAQGWAAYLHGGTLYLKRFSHQPGGAYPDGGSTVEIYSSAEFLELENLGPLTVIEPGAEIVYPEDWWLFAGARIAEDESEALSDIQGWLRRAPFLSASQPAQSVD